MAEIVVGVGSSHTPMVSMGPDLWAEHSERVDHDLPQFDFERLAACAPPWLADEISERVFARKYAAAQEGIARLGAALAQADPDVVLVFGDDQREMFLDDGIPAIGLFVGEELHDFPRATPYRSEGQRVGAWAYHGDEPCAWRVPRELAEFCAASLNNEDFDLAVLRRQPEGRSLGHAFTFVQRRLMPDSPRPLLPVFLNTYYPPNTPSPRRCLDLGRAVRACIEAWPGSERVAIVASGGLSHFVVDEALDRRVLQALADVDEDALSALTAQDLVYGNSEIRNWIAAAGALGGLDITYREYIPAYRSEAQTGVGLAFAVWS